MRNCKFVLLPFFAFFVPTISFAEEVNSAGKEDLKTVIVSPVADDGVYDWSGAYAGFSLGYGLGEATQVYDRAGNHGLAKLTPTGSVAAFTAGTNWLYSPSILLGVEGDLGVMGVAQGTTTVFDGHEWSNSFGAFMTLRGRAGYLINDTLFFGTGGLALASINDTSIGNTIPESAIEEGLNVGWVLGVGAEHVLNQKWTVKGEFLHMDFGEVNGKSAGNEDYTFTDKVNVLRVGLNYKF